MKRKLQAALKDRTQEEILCAIDNYSTVLKSDDYFWSHEWTLEDFISRGLDKFTEEAHPLTNFLKDKGKEQGEPEEDYYDRHPIEPIEKLFSDAKERGTQ